MDGISILDPNTSVAGCNVGENNSNVDTENNSHDKVNTQTQSFASVLKENAIVKIQFPDREQAIVLDAIEQSQKNDYIIGVGKLVGPKNVIFASRISNNRICIYLSTKVMVDDFINNHGGISLNEKFVPARRLVSPAKRIILSNVSPCIPHEVIGNELKRLGLNVVSSITFISAGLHLQEFKHVLSFRRQVYVNLEAKDILPDSILIKYKSNMFRIFVSSDEIKCFLCKKVGHIANKCPDNNSITNEVIVAAEVHNSNLSTKEDKEATNSGSSLISNKKDIKVTDSVSTDVIHAGKRPAPVSVESETSSTRDDILSPISDIGDTRTNPIDNKKFKKPHSREKMKTETIVDESQDFSELREVVNSDNITISFDDYCKFLKEVKGKKNITGIIQELDLSVQQLVILLINSIRIVKTNNLRARLKRIVKKIKKTYGSTIEFTELLDSDDSEFSQSQDYSTDTSDM